MKQLFKINIILLVISLTLFVGGFLVASAPRNDTRVSPTNQNIKTPEHQNIGTPKYQRIISLKPNVTEILFKIGAGDQVVGVTTWCNKPEAAKKLPKVADYIQPNIEKILALKPDLIISSEENSIKGPINKLNSIGIPVQLLSFKTVGDISKSIITIGKTTGHENAALKIAEDIKKDIKGLQNRGGTKTKVLAVVGKRPLIAASRNTFLGEVLEIAGGKNIVTSKLAYPHIDMETIIAKGPDVILDLTMGSETEDNPRGCLPKTTPGVVSGNTRVYVLDISNFRPGPEIGERIKELSKLLYVIPDEHRESRSPPK